MTDSDRQEAERSAAEEAAGQSGVTPPSESETAGSVQGIEPPVTVRPAAPAREPTISVEEPSFGAEECCEEALEERARQAVQQALETAQERAKAALSSRKDRVAESLAATGEAIRRSGEDLRRQGYEAAAGYADQLAARVERFADALRIKTVDELQTGVEEYAHRRPGVLIGVAFVLGLLTAKLFMGPGRRR